MNASRIVIQITDCPIVQEHPVLQGCGALVSFDGIVRGEENGMPIAALEYQAYRPMAEREMERIVTELLDSHPCVWVRVTHRIGIVAVGEAAIAIRIGATHRAEAFAVMSAFMDRLKQDVPIWKIRAIPL